MRPQGRGRGFRGRGRGTGRGGGRGVNRQPIDLDSITNAISQSVSQAMAQVVAQTQGMMSHSLASFKSADKLKKFQNFKNSARIHSGDRCSVIVRKKCARRVLVGGFRSGTRVAWLSSPRPGIISEHPDTDQPGYGSKSGISELIANNMTLTTDSKSFSKNFSQLFPQTNNTLQGLSRGRGRGRGNFRGAANRGQAHQQGRISKPANNNKKAKKKTTSNQNPQNNSAGGDPQVSTSEEPRERVNSHHSIPNPTEIDSGELDRLQNADFLNRVQNEPISVGDHPMPPQTANTDHPMPPQPANDEPADFKGPNEPVFAPEIQVNRQVLDEGVKKKLKPPHVPKDFTLQFDDPAVSFPCYPADLPIMTSKSWPSNWQGLRWAGHHVVNMRISTIRDICRYLNVPVSEVRLNPPNIDTSDNTSIASGIEFTIPEHHSRFLFFMSHALSRDDPFYRVRYAPVFSASFIYYSGHWIYNPPNEQKFIIAIETTVNLGYEMDDLSPEKWTWMRDESDKFTVEEVVGFEQRDRIGFAATEKQVELHQKWCKSFNYRFRPLITGKGDNLERPDRHLTTLFDKNNFTMDTDAYTAFLAEKRKIRELRPYFMNPKLPKTPEIMVKRDQFLQEQRRRKADLDKKLATSKSANASVPIPEASTSSILESLKKVQDDFNATKLSLEQTYGPIVTQVNLNKEDIKANQLAIKNNTQLITDIKRTEYKNNHEVILTMEKLVKRIAKPAQKVEISQEIEGKFANCYKKLIIEYQQKNRLNRESLRKLSLGTLIENVFSGLRKRVGVPLSQKRNHPSTGSQGSVSNLSQAAPGVETSTPSSSSSRRFQSARKRIKGQSLNNSDQNVNPLHQVEEDEDDEPFNMDTQISEVVNPFPNQGYIHEIAQPLSTTADLLSESAAPPSGDPFEKATEADSDEAVNLPETLASFVKDNVGENKHIMTSQKIREIYEKASKYRKELYSAISTSRTSSTAYCRVRKWRGMILKNADRMVELMNTWAADPSLPQCMTFMSKAQNADFCSKANEHFKPIKEFANDYNLLCESFKWSPDYVDTLLPKIPEDIFLAFHTIGANEKWGFEELTNRVMLGHLMTNAAFVIITNSDIREIVKTPPGWEHYIGAINNKKSRSKNSSLLVSKFAITSYEKDSYESLSEYESDENLSHLIDHSIGFFEKLSYQRRDSFSSEKSERLSSNVRHSEQSSMNDLNQSVPETVRNNDSEISDPSIASLIDDFVVGDDTAKKSLLKRLNLQLTSSTFKQLKNFQSEADLSEALNLIGLDDKSDISDADLKFAFTKLNEKRHNELTRLQT